MIFLALQSYDESRSGADAEATLLVQQVETAQFLPKGAATEFTGELVFYGRSVAGIEWDAIDTGTLGKRSTHNGRRCSARSDRGRVHARTTRPPRLDAPTDCRTSGSRTSRPGRGRSCARHPASHDQTSTALREAIMSSACPSHVFSGCSTSVSRSPCAAAEPERPPPAPRSTHAAPTASSTPISGPAT